MSSNTTRLLLKKPDGSDPFLRQDFVDNLAKLDLYPGVYICTSTTRPTWGAAQAGMRIYETDYHREVEWSGTAWRKTRPLSPVESMGPVVPGATLAPGSSSIFTIGTVTVDRPTKLVVSALGNVLLLNQSTTLQSATMDCYINGSSVATISGSNNDLLAGASFTLPSQGAATLAAGSHAIQVRILIGSATSSVYVGSLSALVWWAETTT